MVDRVPMDESVLEEIDAVQEQSERLRWINARIREASEADLIEDAEILDDEDDEVPVV